MPLLGLGTYKLQGKQMHLSVDAALGAGYRAFDTATVYGNEADLGRALLDLMPKHKLISSSSLNCPQRTWAQWSQRAVLVAWRGCG
ncbi:unnamed protein product [Coregonus sp. 'balchen']|nr:unnamed protein product [Coregonus sp. 'balchen']